MATQNNRTHIINVPAQPIDWYSTVFSTMTPSNMKDVTEFQFNIELITTQEGCRTGWSFYHSRKFVEHALAFNIKKWTWNIPLCLSSDHHSKTGLTLIESTQTFADDYKDLVECAMHRQNLIILLQQCNFNTINTIDQMAIIAICSSKEYSQIIHKQTLETSYVLVMLHGNDALRDKLLREVDIMDIIVIRCIEYLITNYSSFSFESAGQYANNICYHIRNARIYNENEAIRLLTANLDDSGNIIYSIASSMFNIQRPSKYVVYAIIDKPALIIKYVLWFDYNDIKQLREYYNILSWFRQRTDIEHECVRKINARLRELVARNRIIDNTNNNTHSINNTPRNNQRDSISGRKYRFDPLNNTEEGEVHE